MRKTFEPAKTLTLPLEISNQHIRRSSSVRYRYCSVHDFKNLSNLNSRLRVVLCKFSLGNHGLPVERGQYNNIERERCFFHLCNENTIGNELYFILV